MSTAGSILNPRALAADLAALCALFTVGPWVMSIFVPEVPLLISIVLAAATVLVILGGETTQKKVSLNRLMALNEPMLAVNNLIIVGVNSAALTAFGYDSSSQLVGMPITTLMSEIDAAHINKLTGTPRGAPPELLGSTVLVHTHCAAVCVQRF